MTYRGIVSNGVVVLDGEKPQEGTLVEVTPLVETAKVIENSKSLSAAATHPAIGIWKDRKDLPADSTEASKILRQRLMRRVDE